MDIIIMFQNNYKKDSLPLLTVLMLIVNVVVLITLLVKSDGLSSLTSGDYVVISVVGGFTLCIVVADVIYCIRSRNSGLFYKQTEACTDFESSGKSKDGTVKLKCGHDVHEKCISQPIEQYVCPLCSKKPRGQFKEMWIKKFTTKVMLILNWPRFLQTEQNEEVSGLVSIV